MDLKTLLVFIWMSGIGAELEQEPCVNYALQFERVFSVPGDVAMLTSTLLSLFDHKNVSYDIRWFDPKTKQEITEQPGKILIVGETLWVLNVSLEDDGEYQTVVRPAGSRCFTQSTRLVVNLPPPDQCGRPLKIDQPLTNSAADKLNCPLSEYIAKLESYNVSSSIRWYKGCELIPHGTDKHAYRDKTKLNFQRVAPSDGGTYTCTLTFALGGVTGSVSESIEAVVREEHSLSPQMHAPANEIIKAVKGSNFSKNCVVFVPGVGVPWDDLVWYAGGDFLANTNAARRIYTRKHRWENDKGIKGMFLEQLLIIAELKDEDFNVNYTCQVHSSRGNDKRYFTLLESDPDYLVPIGSILGAFAVLFVAAVAVYRTLRIDLVLCFRGTFPVFYVDKDSDGKLYDAYVAYDSGFNGEAETFALCALTKVLENECGYKLFIAGRDGEPGQATADSVSENIQASRRFLLLYDASTFASVQSIAVSNNNNDVVVKSGERTVCWDARQQLECLTAMHKALLEGSIKVILVELEEISAAQLASFPESVRHLRKKQGAVCLWKDIGTKPRCRRTVAEEAGQQRPDPMKSPPLSPSSRFWKEMRFHLPVRGKRKRNLDQVALLNV